MDKESRQGLGWFLLAIVLLLLAIATEPPGILEVIFCSSAGVSAGLGIIHLLMRDD